MITPAQEMFDNADSVSTNRSRRSKVRNAQNSQFRLAYCRVALASRHERTLLSG
jgi:hypothetical protein